VAERLAERLGDLVAERLAERLGDLLAERLGDFLGERLGDFLPISSSLTAPNSPFFTPHPAFSN